MDKYKYVYVWMVMFMSSVCWGATLETLSLSLRPRDGGLVPAWYHISYVMIDSRMVVWFPYEV